jgi:hypothetical protein
MPFIKYLENYFDNKKEMIHSCSVLENEDVCWKNCKTDLVPRAPDLLGHPLHKSQQNCFHHVHLLDNKRGRILERIRKNKHALVKLAPKKLLAKNALKTTFGLF